VAGNRWTRRGAASSRSALAALTLVGGVALAGCAAGQQAQTAEQRPTVNGANVNLGSLAIRNVTLDYPEEGVYEEGSDARLQMVVVNEATSGDALIEVRSPVAQRVTITAGGAEAGPTPTLTAPPPSESPSETAQPSATRENPSPSISGGDPVDPSASGSFTGSASPASPVPTPAPGEPESVDIPIPTNGLVAFREDGPTILLTGLTEQLRPSQVITVTLVFQNAGEIELAVPVGVPEEQISTAPTFGEAEGREGTED
jgi:copper(I)-binding protein